MIRSHLAGRLAASTVLLVASASALGLTAIASPTAAGAASNAYGGTSSGNIVALSAVTVPGTAQLANVDVAPANSIVSSTGNITQAPAPLDTESYARAANLDAQLLNGALPLNNLIVEAKQAAGVNHTTGVLTDNPTGVTKTLASVPADPLLNATVADANANARWLGAQCVPVGTDISHSTSELATANVLTGTPLASTAAVSVINSAGGPVTSDSSIGLVNVAGHTTEGLKSDQIDQITGIVLFKGSATQVTINVLAPPELTAVATGQPGGASVTYTEPVLQIVQGGKIVATLDTKTANTSFTIPALATISLGKLTSTVNPNGTSAVGSTSLATIALGVSPLPLNVATVAIAPSSVSATVPAGGIYCPPAANPLSESHKDASAASIAPGKQFNYTLTIPNRGTCTLVNVTAVDTITAPAGTTIVGSVPPANATNGYKLTYNIGSLAPNQTDNIQITLQAPTNLAPGTEYHNDADISGVCQGAPAGTPPFTVHVHIDGPTAFAPTVLGCHLDESNKAADHLKVFVGETFNYYIHVLNDGTQPCGGVTISDTVPPNVTFVSATDGGTLSGGVVTWNLGTINSGASRSVALQVKVNPVATNTTLPDTALISSPSEPKGVRVTAPGPVVTGISVLAPPNLPVGAGGPVIHTLPSTGGQPLAPYGLGLLLAGVGGFAWRRRSRRIV